MIIDGYKLDVELDDTLWDLRIQRNYSGRAMYGKKCLGVVGDAGDLLRFVLEIAPAIDPEGDGRNTYSEEWFNVRTDSMGKDMIFYWPSIEVHDEPDTEGEHPSDAKERMTS